MKKAILIPVLLFSLRASALSFDEAVDAALAGAPDVKILRLEAESARRGETRAKAGFLPKIDVGGRHLFSERFQELEVEFGGSTFAMPAIQPYSSLGVTASLNLFSGFETLNELRAAKSARAAAEHRLKHAEDVKRSEIRTLFYRALGSQVLVGVAEQNARTLESHLNEVRSRVRGGVSTQYDSLRVEVQLEDARTEKVAAENSVADARAKLFEALGRDDDGLPLRGTLPADFGVVDAKNVKPRTEREDRAALIDDRDRAASLAKGARGHWMPKVSLVGNYEWYNNVNHELTGDDQRFKSAYNLGVQLSWALFDGGADLAKQRQAAIARSIAEEKLSIFDRSSALELEAAKRRFAYDVVNYRAKVSSIKKAEEAVRLARSGARAGTRTNAEVLDAVVDLNRAKAAAVKSQIDAIEAIGRLETSAGVHFDI